MTLNVQLISQEKVFLKAEAGEVILPTPLGQTAILPGHRALVVELSAGEVELTSGLGGSTIASFAVTGGVAEVRNGKEVLILAPAAELAEEIHEERARVAMERAQKILREEGFKDDVKFAQATAALERSLSRLRVARKRKKHGPTL
ncbi:MAG: ATP synthase F1 subunit epsilon [Gammaproteobacteria bacterium RIFCSPLOWO2_02_FULL_57_10]|nr:MAG: ATP synthase F1 subunit epsilon [Gammaproteobacteria bacterium RIFCSPLOWO2_02_FULL_57_10]